MKKFISFACIVLAIACLCSCASLKGKDQEIVVKSNPAGASVKIDGVSRGTTPIVVHLDKTTAHVFEFSMEGYETQFVELRTKTDKGAIAGDILLFGALTTVFDSSSARVLESNEVWVEMVPVVKQEK